jgi:hypothetical protein
VLLNPSPSRRILKRPIYPNDPGSISKSKHSHQLETIPKTQKQASTPVMEDVAMNDAPQVPAYFPVHGSPRAAPTAKPNLVGWHTPFPQSRPTMAPYIRLLNERLLVPIHSQLPNQIICCLIHTLSLAQSTCLPTRKQGRAEEIQHGRSHLPYECCPVAGRMTWVGIVVRLTARRSSMCGGR